MWPIDSLKPVVMIHAKTIWYYEKWVGSHASFPPRRSVKLFIPNYFIYLGSYNEWNSVNPASETYCDQIPFSFAMGALIANWILLLVRGIPSSMKYVHPDYVAL